MNLTGTIRSSVVLARVAYSFGVLIALSAFTISSAASPDTALPLPSTPSNFRVVKAVLRANPSDYANYCPTIITFRGRISAVGNSGRVSYKFVRSDGVSGPLTTVKYIFEAAKDVRMTWQLGRPGQTYAGWVAIQILEPQKMKSKPAHFKIKCN